MTAHAVLATHAAQVKHCLQFTFLLLALPLHCMT